MAARNWERLWSGFIQSRTLAAGFSQATSRASKAEEASTAKAQKPQDSSLCALMGVNLALFTGAAFLVPGFLNDILTVGQFESLSFHTLNLVRDS